MSQLQLDLVHLPTVLTVLVTRHGTTLHPAAVRAVFEPGTSQKAGGLTKVLTNASIKTFVSALGPGTSHSIMCCCVFLKPPFW